MTVSGKKIRNGAIASILAGVLMLSVLPAQSAWAQSTEPGSLQTQDITDVTPSQNSYTVSVDFAGGTTPQGLSENGWTQSADGTWTTLLTETTPGEGARLSIPTPQRDGYLFTGWRTSDSDETLLDLADYQITDNTKFTATWQQQSETSTDSEDPDTSETSTETEQATPKESEAVPTPNALSTSDGDQSTEQKPNAKYSIRFDSATYQAKVGVSGTNTIDFSHVNANYPMTVDDIVKFLNQYVPSVELVYTITYTDDGTEGQKTVTRSGVPLKIEWNEKNIDLEDIKNLSDELTNMDGKSSEVRPKAEYLKTLIAGYEKSQSSDQLPGAPDLTAQDFEIPNTDKTALTVKIGSSQNKEDASTVAESHTIDTVSPSNVTLNLFDYWLSDRAYNDRNDKSTAEICPFGINQGHGLLFSGKAPGTWNQFTGAKKGPRTGIVKDKLGENGYPTLDLSKFKASDSFTDDACGTYDPNESLQYLFDPTKFNADVGGKAYTGVQNLFKMDESGNYYYSSHDNFAEFDPESNAFNVYDTWGVEKGGTSPDGQFFPFNTADQVFDVDPNGNLTQAGVVSTNDLINHYLGLSMTAEFQQPMNGMVSVGANAKPMVFNFSGDDDVWIFIDGVLVADLGGIHDEASMQIDFSTGKVTTYLASDPSKNRTETTLKKLFEDADISTDSFNGDTFGGNTTHTLKMFYLERGNVDSNLTLSFNLMEPKNDTLVKLDQDGKPVAGASFSIYPAEKSEDGEYVKASTESIGTNLISDQNGMVQLPNDYDFGQHDYYLLEENVPDGYFSPGQVVLRYDRFQKHDDGTTTGTNLLMVENRWETGAVSNFSATVYQAGTLKYNNGATISNETGRQGLILAVPLLKGTDGEWHPLYGSNMSGFHDVDYQSGGDDETKNQRQAILKAALYQIYGANHRDSSYEYSFPEWYLEWNQEQGRYEGDLIDLPGDASRYYWASNDPNADLSVAYYFLDLQKLNVNGIFDQDITGMSSEDKLKAIAAEIDDMAGNDVAADKVQTAVEGLTGQIDDASGFALLDVSDFNRVFSSRIYIPNIQPELAVLKLDEQGNPLKGAQFTLYKSDNNTETGQMTKVTSGTTDANGVLVFSASGTDNAGSAKVTLKQGYYWVKETAVPDGYIENTEYKYIPVYVTENGRVYADALNKDDGITVHKGLGRLLETMVRYATEDSVNTTLQDITATLVTGNDWGSVGSVVNGNTTGNSSTGKSINLHYGLDNALLEYGTHEVNGVRPNPYFEVDEDIPGIQVRQNYRAHEGETLYSSVAAKTNLEDTNIRGLFTGSTTIVVRNRKTDSQGRFSVAKTVTGSGAEMNKAFDFDVSIEGTGESAGDVNWSNNQATASYTVTGDTGQLETGTLTFTKSNGSWRITGVAPEPDASPAASAYFVQGTNPSCYRMHLGDGQKIFVTGVPFGMTVTVREVNADGYVTSVTVNNGNLTQSDEANGVVARPVGDPSFHFYNNKGKTADLTLAKLLPGESDSKTKFPFTIELWTSDGGQRLAGSYGYTVTRVGESTPYEGTIDKDKGELTVNLGHNDILTIEGLPVGARYIIKETTKGYAPTVTVDGKEVNVVDGAISGTIQEKEGDGSQTEGNDSQPAANAVVYTNTRSGSITITKRNGTGQLLSGAGFTLYTKDASGKLTAFMPEQLTALAMRYGITGEEFDEDTMRYNKGTESYVVHTADDGKSYFYYRLLTDAEREQYYAGTLPDKENVEAIVQFDELPLDNTYAIKETTVPQGYVQNADIEQTMSNIKLPFEKNETNKIYDVLYTVVNHKQMTLPTSGLDGIGKMLATGLLLTTLAAVLLWLANRRIPGAGPDPNRRPRH